VLWAGSDEISPMANPNNSRALNGYNLTRPMPTATFPLKVTPVLTPIQYPVTISIPIRIFTGTSQQSSAESLIVVRSQKCLPGELSFAQALSEIDALW